MTCRLRKLAAEVALEATVVQVNLSSVPRQIVRLPKNLVAERTAVALSAGVIFLMTSQVPCGAIVAAALVALGVDMLHIDVRHWRLVGSEVC